MGKLLIVRKQSKSRVLTVTKIIPDDWRAVDLDNIKRNGDTLIIKLVKVK